MSSYVTYDPASHMVVVTLIGVIDEATMNATAAEARRIAFEHSCFKMLGDLRQAVSAVSTIAIFGRAQQSRESFGSQAPQTKRAIVIADHSEDALFYETVSVNRGQNVRLFHDIDEAKRWLSG